MANRIGRPPYFDPVTNIRFDTDCAEFEGWLTKQSAWVKDWRRRYFILKGSKLFFAKTGTSAPHGMIDLSTCTTVKSADVKTRKNNSFEISTHDTTFFLYADNEKEKDDWIGNVGRAIVRCSSTYQGGVVKKSSGSGAGMDNQGEEDDDSSVDSDNPYAYH
uniref:PH domain-containing protein n=1 Tax=Leptocylindrus danicus TaxID=163516 RepID=A0A7S2LSC0_9STRA|mmetsp:Transcript_9357/g.14079  ORF Transcript_9357/g.14079 Transcript_9357/m.14079 type:complete len:161 (+) Transcript_9357:50-532(+)